MKKEQDLEEIRQEMLFAKEAEREARMKRKEEHEEAVQIVHNLLINDF